MNKKSDDIKDMQDTGLNVEKEIGVEKETKKEIIEEEVDGGVEELNLWEEEKKDTQLNKPENNMEIVSDKIYEDNSTKNKKKSNITKIIIVIILVVIALVAFGFYTLNKNNTATLEKSMKDAALDYFDKYITGNSAAGAYKITLANLQNANKNEGEKYDLSNLDKCDAEKTWVSISIDYSNGEVKGTEVRLNCKKF